MILVLGVAFLAEVAALGILAAWGWQLGAAPLARWLLALALPLAFAAVWGVLLAPRASVTLPVPAVMAGKAVMFALAALALARLTAPGWALAFFVVAVTATLVGLQRPA